MNMESDNMALVHKTYIESGRYKRKFDNATDNSDVNKALYEAAKKALKHRSRTELKDKRKPLIEFEELEEEAAKKG